MACYGGHLPVVQYLVATANANANDNIHEITNEWGCNAFHFVGLTINDDETAIWNLCNYLYHELSMTKALLQKQNQGHTILHKAAQKGNLHVIQWVADLLPSCFLSKEEQKQIGSPDRHDDGGYTPSQIWRKFNTDSSVADWMESLGW
eukprot:scaffold67_cov80-Cylindrotheca_fusiformis.AAC.4